MNIAQAKALPILAILAKMGAIKKEERGDDAWFFSPLREEKTPSLHINSRKNVWYDFGQPVGQNGGNVIDLVCAWLNARGESATAKDALAWLSKKHEAQFITEKKHQADKHREAGWIVKWAKPVSHLALVRYLERRGIPLTLARKHLKEVLVESKRTGKGIVALGFENEEGGYELRNSFLKSAVSPKHITFIRGSIPKPDTVHVFEGFMDFFSASLQSKVGELDGDTIVLNSLSMIEQAIAYMKGYGYRLACSWLDNNPAGDSAALTLAKFVKSEEGLTLKRMNALYEGHEDVNAWHMHKLGLPKLESII